MNVNTLNDIILDVKIYIALFDQEVWIKLVLWDDEFHNYAYKREGLRQFVNNFHKIIHGRTILFKKCIL